MLVGIDSKTGRFYALAGLFHGCVFVKCLEVLLMRTLHK